MAMHGKQAAAGSVLTIGLFFAAGCAAPPRSTLPPPRTEAPAPKRAETAPAPSEQSSIVQLAREYLGTPYRYGGSSSKGMDCSGLVLRVFDRAGHDLPRTSASQFRVGEPVERESLAPGDLVFFVNDKSRVNHVGIYTGKNRFIHASTGKRVVRYDSLKTKYFRTRYAGARRIVQLAR